MFALSTVNVPNAPVQQLASWDNSAAIPPGNDPLPAEFSRSASVYVHRKVLNVSSPFPMTISPGGCQGRSVQVQRNVSQREPSESSEELVRVPLSS